MKPELYPTIQASFLAFFLLDLNNQVFPRRADFEGRSTEKPLVSVLKNRSGKQKVFLVFPTGSIEQLFRLCYSFIGGKGMIF